MIKVERIKCGNGNCFLIHENGNAVLVDTAVKKHRDRVLNFCKTMNVKLILLTHGHIDHVQNTAYLSKKLNAPVAMHKDDFELILNNMSRPLLAHTVIGKLLLRHSMKILRKEKIEPFCPIIFVEDGDSLFDVGLNAKIVGLPGHTKGSVGVLVDDREFIVGDALMNILSPSKTLLYEDKENMVASSAKVKRSNACIIHFGHGNSTSDKTW